MRINDSEYGGFIVSKNVKKGRPIRYSFRENPTMPGLNGWTIYSCDDDQQFIENSSNFIILGAKSIYKIAPVMLAIYNAPFGTDLCWLYESDVHVGFYDLKRDKETTIEEILTPNDVNIQ